MPIIGTTSGVVVPKIIYGTAALSFTLPPVQKPGADDRLTEREDSITLTGLKQSIFIRTDRFFTLQMDFVPVSDLPNWEAFIEYALQGNTFDYYPDSTLSTKYTCTLEDQKWTPTRGHNGYAKFSLRLRKSA